MCFLLVGQSTALAADYYVNNVADLQYALQNAQTGDVIKLNNDITKACLAIELQE